MVLDGFPGSLLPVLLPKHWRIENVARLLLGLTTSWLIAVALAIGLSGAARQRGETFPPAAMLALTGLGVHGVGLVLIGRFLRHEHRSVREAFGCDSSPGESLRRAGLWMLAVGPLVYGLHQGVGLLLERWGWNPKAQEAVELLMGSGWTGRLVVALFALGFAPVVEEALFRGILFPALRDAGWHRAAYGVASLGFGIVHGNLAALLPLAVFGGFLAWLYVRTGNLLAPITAHFLFNLVPFALLVTGLAPTQ